MILGKTTAQKLAEKNAKIMRLLKGVSKYAWYPVKLDTGQWIWFDYYYAYYHIIDCRYYGTPRYSLIEESFTGYKKTCSLNSALDCNQFITVWD